MPIRVLFFGATADETGMRSYELPAEFELNAGGAFERVLMEFPQLRRHKLFFAVNQEYVPETQVLKDGDELAVFTAVSGG
jgi:molybdopterin converting factor small subunit